MGGATYRLVGPLTLPSPPASGGRGVKGRVVRATLRRQIFEQPVVTLSPDSLVGCPDAQPFRPGGNWSLMRRFGRGQIGRVGRLQRREASGGDAVLRRA
jgi:hypothetical protein